MLLKRSYSSWIIWRLTLFENILQKDKFHHEEFVKRYHLKIIFTRNYFTATNWLINVFLKTFFEKRTISLWVICRLMLFENILQMNKLLHPESFVITVFWMLLSGIFFSKIISWRQANPLIYFSHLKNYFLKDTIKMFLRRFPSNGFFNYASCNCCNETFLESFAPECQDCVLLLGRAPSLSLNSFCKIMSTTNLILFRNFSFIFPESFKTGSTAPQFPILTYGFFIISHQVIRSQKLTLRWAGWGKG